MTSAAIYRDIATRTGGDIYIGVVGPVRTGKSTFIKRFMDTLVIPHIEDTAKRERAVDELPQSAAGRTIMTTEPKFIPEDAVHVTIDRAASMNVRLIDCVGYIVPSALGYIEDEAPRMVKTPWFDEEVPFNLAAELGTQKVITEHSTIGLVVTTDGSIGDIPREEYAEVEKRIIDELKAINKPFVVLLNCTAPESPAVRQLAASLEQQYGVPVCPVDCLTVSEEQMLAVLERILYEFPVRELEFDMPRWMLMLGQDHPVRCDMMQHIRDAASNVKRLRDSEQIVDGLLACEYVENSRVKNIRPGSGAVCLSVQLQNGLFYRLLGEVTGFDLPDEAAVMDRMTELATTARRYEKFKNALDEVEATGYGIVMPALDELELDEPEIIKQSGQYGVRLRAQAPSIHMLRADIMTEVSPIVGSEKQSEDLVSYLLREFEENPGKIWESNIFGTSLYGLVNEGLHNKLARMPMDARMKLKETVERIINDGCSGLICIIV